MSINFATQVAELIAAVIILISQFSQHYQLYKIDKTQKHHSECHIDTKEVIKKVSQQIDTTKEKSVGNVTSMGTLLYNFSRGNTVGTSPWTAVQENDMATLWDKNRDMVGVKINGTANVTQLVVTTVANYEIIPLSTSAVLHFANQPKYAPKSLDMRYNEYRLKETKPLSYIYKKR